MLKRKRVASVVLSAAMILSMGSRRRLFHARRGHDGGERHLLHRRLSGLSV